MFFFPLNVCEDSSSTSATQAEKEEVDSRSIYVGNVRLLSLTVFRCKLEFLVHFHLLVHDPLGSPVVY